jgi:23S rRNA (pseudouridine1915-N3)-methyltransferase
MKYSIVAIGRCKDKHILALCDEYSKRLKATVSIIEIPAIMADGPTRMRKEGEKLLAAIPENAYVIALDERGKSLSSIALSKQLDSVRLQGHAHICLIIGGADGLTPEIRKRADLLLSLSPLTFPHQMVRIILLEQLYRAHSISDGHPYHRE